jgi:hypothetical protein
MDREQLNKIDEEFWEKASHTIKLIPTSQRELFKVEMTPLIKSLLQEAYELARGDAEEEYERGRNAGFVECSKEADRWIENAKQEERERAIDTLSKMIAEVWDGGIKYDGEQIKWAIDIIKSLQTNKE